MRDPVVEVFSRTVLVSLLLVFRPAMAQAKRNHHQASATMPELPRFGHAHLANHTTRVGSEVQFSCTVEHLGDYRVAWLHSEKGTLAVYPAVITQNNRISVSFDNRATYHLKLQAVQESDAGKYICQINTGPVISISGTLSVVVPPDITDEESSSDTLATEGMRVLLNCRARGNPAPTISWRREDDKNIQLCNADGKKLKECKEVRVHYGNELELSQVSRFDSGVYLCLASNGVPPTVSKRVRLYVDFSPTLWISHQLVGAELGSSAELECLTAAHPPSLNFWTRDGGDSYITTKEGKYVFERRTGEPSFYNVLMKIRILNITEADFGTYRCLAKNSQGETDGEINLYEVARPSTTTHLYNFEDFAWGGGGGGGTGEKDASDAIAADRLNKTMLVLLDEEESEQQEKTRHNGSKKHNRKKGNKKRLRKDPSDDEHSPDHSYHFNVANGCPTEQQLTSLSTLGKMASVGYTAFLLTRTSLI